MSLKQTIQKAVKKALDATGDLKTLITYTKVVTGAYDPASDTVVTTLTEYPVNALLVKLSEDDMDWFPANLTGQKVLIAYKDLPIETNDVDYLMIDNVRWNIHKRKPAPGNVLHVLYVRNP